MKVLVIGSGGREHCLVWKLSQSSSVEKIYCAPGNAGTQKIAENIDIGVGEIDKLVEFVLEEKIDLTVVGPEAPLVEGIVDKFQEKGLKIFGPGKDLALLEGSKVFAKEMMKKYKVPTADFEVFDDLEEAKNYVKEKGAPLVVKADGLAAGKGVIVCETQGQAYQALDLIMAQKHFKFAGDKVVIEDCLKGQELSVLIFTDGDTILPLVSSQDHKRAFEGDKGPNTGGMGAYSPTPLVDDRDFDKIINIIFKPLIEGLKSEGKNYIGMLYGGIMMQEGEPYVLEFNVRFGDPEAQAILPKLKSDLADVMLKTIDGELSSVKLEWDQRYCLCVVLASGGYPGKYEKGKVITGLEKLEDLEDIFVFHAGTKKTDLLLTNGGRVLGVSGLGNTIDEAQEKVYKAAQNINFDKMFYRKDIGDKAKIYQGR